MRVRGKLTDKQCEAIDALAFSNMRVSEAARKCGIGWQTFSRRLEGIRRKTGLDPRNFFDLQDLFEMSGR